MLPWQIGFPGKTSHPGLLLTCHSSAIVRNRLPLSGLFSLGLISLVASLHRHRPDKTNGDVFMDDVFLTVF